ncbi:hypothetical protein BDW22DRAFT_1355103 [Trametopsis cervina]|nr:hypothetical protein BDW22DRAFT_1355103 [Trametopsis cervina]
MNFQRVCTCNSTSTTRQSVCIYARAGLTYHRMKYSCTPSIYRRFISLVTVFKLENTAFDTFRLLRASPSNDFQPQSTAASQYPLSMSSKAALSYTSSPISAYPKGIKCVALTSHFMAPEEEPNTIDCGS